MQTRYILSLIGPFGLKSGDGRKIILGSRKSRALIAMLATGDGGRRSRVWLQDRLWGNVVLAKGQANLRRELSNLRKTLAEQDADDILDISADNVELDLARVDVDFLDALNGKVDHAIMLGSEFLEGLDLPGEEGFEDWLRVCRSSLETVREQAESRGLQSPVSPAVPAQSQPSFKTKLAVLPFSHWTSDPRGEALVDSLVEETSHVLSRYATLQVIDPATSLSFRNKNQQVEFIRDAGLRYFVTGNVRQQDDQLKVTVGLVDCATNLKVWSGKFDGETTNFFDLPEQIAVTLAPEIDGTIDRNEQRTARSAPVTNPDAYALYWQANAVFRDWTPQSVAEAVSLTDQILELEDKNAWAKSLGGFCRAILVAYQWSQTPDEHRKEAKAFAFQATEWEPNEPIVLGYAAGTLGLMGEDIGAAETLVQRALAMDYPTSGIYFWSGWIALIRRDFAGAGAKFATCMELNPNSSVRPFMLAGIALARLAEAKPEEAAIYAKEALALMPHQPVTLAAAGAIELANGNPEKAAALARTFQDVDGIEAIGALFQNEGEKHMAAAIIDRVANGSAPDIAPFLAARAG